VWFNPVRWRFGSSAISELLVVDDTLAFLGGCNIARIRWRRITTEVEGGESPVTGPVVSSLVESFQGQAARATRGSGSGAHARGLVKAGEMSPAADPGPAFVRRRSSRC